MWDVFSFCTSILYYSSNDSMFFIKRIKKYQHLYNKRMRNNYRITTISGPEPNKFITQTYKTFKHYLGSRYTYMKLNIKHERQKANFLIPRIVCTLTTRLHALIVYIDSCNGSLLLLYVYLKLLLLSFTST